MTDLRKTFGNQDFQVDDDITEKIDIEEITVKSKIVDIQATSKLLDLEEDKSLTLRSKRIKPLQANTTITKGMLQAIAIVVGYLPLSFAFGVMAHNAHLNFQAATLMSAIVFAGSSQYMAIGMIAAAQPVVSIVLATLIINLRHLLMSTAIAPHLKSWSKKERLLFAFELTDETFALHMSLFSERPAQALQGITTNITAHVSWVLGTILGFLTGNKIGDVRALGLDFALAAMFIALLVMQARNRLLVLVAFFSASLAIALSVYGMKTWSVMIASMIAATIGLLGEQWITQRSS